ncbi:hypothetical protein DERP_000578, partial [Dermatophagoides pteronyssinus]
VHKELYCSSRHHLITQQQSIGSSSSLINQQSNLNNSNSNQQQQSNMTYSGSNNNCNKLSSQTSSSTSTSSSSGIGSSPPLSTTFSSSSPTTNSSINSTIQNNNKHSCSSILSNDLIQESNINNESSTATTNEIISDECNKYTDFHSLFPGLLPIGNQSTSSTSTSSTTVVPINGMAQQINKSIHNTTPIYIVISTNPLILIPFIFNNLTTTFEPLPSLAANLDESIVENLKNLAPSSTSSLMFPIGLNNQQSSTTMQPFITTFDEMRKSIKSSKSMTKLSSTTNKSLSSTKNEKSSHSNIAKRSHSDANLDQPLDLSSSLITKRSKSESDNQDMMTMFVNTSSDSSSTVKKELENEESISSSLTNKQQTFQEHMNNLLQKFAMMQSMNSVIGSETTTTTNSNLPPSSSSSHTQFDDNQLQSNPYENPAFAQYLAMAMAALTTTNGGQSNLTSIQNPTIKQPSISSTPSSSSSSSHVDVVVKQGNSRCEECNIVFYKHETASVSPAASSSMLSPTKQQSAIFQYFCAACGIKYTSYDNLYAHQTYYCLKRNNGSTVAGPASAAVSAVPSAPLSPVTELSSTGSFEEDFIVQNTDLPEPSNQQQEEIKNNNNNNKIIDEQQQQQQLKKASSLSSLINENQQQQQSSQSSQQQQQQIQNHNCQFCPYQSNYKGNVIRHIKLVHKEINGSSSSSSLSSLQQQQLVKEAMDVLMGNVDLSALPDDLLMINNNNNNCVESQDFSIIKSKSPTPNKLQMNGCIPSSAIDCSSKSNKQIDIKHNNINNKLQESSMKKNSVTNNLSIAGNKKTTTAATTTTTNETTTTTNKNNDNNDLDSRYCNACNISFTYRNSYLAHKRYYCSSNNNSNNSNDT